VSRWLVMLVVALLAAVAVAGAWTGADGDDRESIQPIEVVPREVRPNARDADRRERREPRFEPAPALRAPVAPQPAPTPPPPVAPQPAPSPAPAPPVAPPAGTDDDDDGGGDDDEGDDDGDD